MKLQYTKQFADNFSETTEIDASEIKIIYEGKELCTLEDWMKQVSDRLYELENITGV